MSEVNAVDARRLSERVQRDSERFEAFLYGYVHGAQDMDSDISYTKDEFGERVRMLYRDQFEDALL